MQNVLDILEERGFVQQISEPEILRRQLEHPVTLYCGYDATAPSLTAGHLVTIMMLSWFERCGHRPIALLGGGTTLIGDPTFRQTSRPILSVEEIERNIEAIKGQLSHFLDFSQGAILANNAEWLVPLHYVEFMREIGSRFTVNEVLRLEAYRTRLEAGGLTFLEFSYVLMQAYDFLQLYQRFGCTLQIGGSDQWGNSIAGADLIRRVSGGEAYVLVSPLLTTASGAKMGKTAEGAVWLSAARTTPYEYYQYWRNTDDRDVERYLALFTFLPMDEVRALGSLQGAELNRAKEVLAFEATKLAHGEEAAAQAQETARALFAGQGQGNVPAVEIPAARLEAGISVPELFKLAGLVPSANEARRMITQGGLSINGAPVTDSQMRVTLDTLQDGALMLSRGRKQHKRVTVS